jgi:predicted nuclease of predicted toxin-antitoxin system
VRFKLDENLSPTIAGLLTEAGHDTATVAEQGLAGAEDPDIALVRLDEGRILLTLDLDFADVRAYPPHRYHGLIVLRISSQAPRRQMEVVSRILPSLSGSSLQGKLWIVEDSRIRIRE